MKKVISASVTPLLENGALDKQGLCNILERNIRHGIDGVFLFGSMGEWGSFDDKFKEEAVETAAPAVSEPEAPAVEEAGEAFVEESFLEEPENTEK